MTNELQVFSYTEQHKIRTTVIDGEPWFVAKDVCNVLDMTVEATRRLDEDEKGLTNIQTLGGNQSMTVINESGLYALIFRSNKPRLNSSAAGYAVKFCRRYANTDCTSQAKLLRSSTNLLLDALLWSCRSRR